MSETMLRVEQLKVHFPIQVGSWLRSQQVMLRAVDDVSFEIAKGETLGVVGESGCGKSTLGRAILQLIKPSAGKVVWQGENIAGLRGDAMRQHRQDLQIIFQDPLACLDPRMTIGDIIAEPLITFEKQLDKNQLKQRVKDMMQTVGLLPEMINRYPHEFSGGQCQRIGIARAMILKPKLIVCDEPVSALDVSIQAQIINLLMQLQREFGLSLLFISHDLSVVRQISQRILVLYLGKVVELAVTDSIYDTPLHPYTQALISAVPIPDPAKERAKQRVVLKGDLPSPLNPPSGCVFRTRCAYADAVCAERVPELRQATADQAVACHHYEMIKQA